MLEPTDYSTENQKIFALLTIQGKFKLIGSAAIQGIEYKNDVDLYELATYNKNQSHLKHLLEIFRAKFLVVHKNPDWYVSDFKCGEHKGEPLRWTQQDMKKGYKKIGADKIMFEDCIMQRTTLKLDLVCLVNGLFSEYTENYYIKIGNETNYDPESQQPKNIKQSILDSAKEEKANGNLLKFLKRIYSYLKLTTTKKALQTKLEDFFNSDAGLLYKCKSNLETVILVLEQKCKPANMKDVENDIQSIKQILYNIVGLDSKKISQLEKISVLKSKTKMKSGLEKVIKYLMEVVNKASTKFIKKEKRISSII